ncbi:MAG: hypothetical protein N2489_08225 [Clostridia bacterium]|nr:hypothetical protein [Clostridia bacterium]
MSIDLILSIKQAELQAEQMRRELAETARQILSEANNQAFKLFEQSIEEAEKDARDIIKQAEERVAVEIERLNLEVSQECDVIRQHAREKLDKAVDLITGRIVTVHGNS